MGTLDISEFEDATVGIPGYRGAKGSIIRLKIEDFMTYRNVEMKAGPHVNLIMGPNGTGKSTIVCAICLGLAGKPKILGRAHSLKEYIRHGATKASVEIELFNPESLTGTGSNWVVKRVIEDSHSRGANSDWFLNGRKCRENQIEKLMKSLSIQLDNLCSFLPQDRVQDFAKMDSIHLLKSTEQSIDSEHGGRLSERHESLIQLKEEVTQLRKKLTKSDESLRIEVQHNVQLENEVRAFQDREKMQKDIEQLEGKKLWLLFQLALNDFSELKREWEEKEAKRKKEEQLLVPRESELNLIKSRLAHHREEQSKLRSQSLSLLDRVKRQYEDAVHTAESLVDQSKAEIETAERKERDHGRRMEELKERINGWKTELEELTEAGYTNYDELNGQIREIEQQQREISRKISELTGMDESDRNELRLAQNEIRKIDNDLRAMSDFRSSRMKFLERSNADAAKAVQYFRDPANVEAAGFRGPIHEPLILHIYVNDLAYGKIAEQCVPQTDLSAYFCENKEDLRKMMAITKQKGWRISCIHHAMPQNFRKPRANWYSEEAMREYGFVKNLVDLIEAPDYYMSYICKTVKPQDMLIGTEQTDRLAGQIIANTSMRFFFTLNYSYTIRTSSYTGERNSSISHIQPARIFTDQINAAERDKLELALKERRREVIRLEAQIQERRPMVQELQGQTNELDGRKKMIIQKMDNSKRVQRSLDIDEGRLRRMEDEKTDIDALRAQHSRKILEAKKVQEQALVRYNRSVNDMTQKYVDILVHQRQTTMLQQMLATKQNLLEEARVTVQALVAELRELEASKARAADAAKRKKAEAQKKTNSSAVPDDVKNGRVNEEELDVEINRLQAQLNFLPDTDDDVLREYQARKTRITDMEKSKAELEETLSRLEVDMEGVKKAWLEPLRELIAKVNVNFGKFFANMQCVGEVSLDHGEDENDFAKYGVKIKVKFRASEPLVELCGWKQSGGERAITTALYILALQELTKVPFRVIDEINQGMDAKNEARFFHLLCELATGDDTPQYFLLTPKLLPPVEYPDNVDFHIIFNGPHVEVLQNLVGLEQPNEVNRQTKHHIPSDAETTEDETTDDE